MVQLKISSETHGEETHPVRHFPFRIGRAADADLRLLAEGVWDHHLELDFDPAQGFVLSTQPNALATVNGWPIHAVILRNGDSIEIGALRIRFWLGETRQARLRSAESGVWLSVALVTALQAALLFWLLR
jgi:pSer/pThr/pTyr-binding forkhead associated (FHA) protein